MDANEVAGEWKQLRIDALMKNSKKASCNSREIPSQLLHFQVQRKESTKVGSKSWVVDKDRDASSG